MKKFSSKIPNISFLNSIGFAILGILLIFQSTITIVTISYVIGAVLIAIGVAAIIKFMKALNEKQKASLDIVYGIVTVIFGIIVICNPTTIASIIPFIVGIIIVISSAKRFQYSLEMREESNNDVWPSTLIMSILTMICGIVLIFNPFKGAVFITKLVGILILIYAILDIISSIVIQRTMKNIHVAIEEKIGEADVVEEQEVKENKNEEEPKEKDNKKKRKEKDE